MGSSRDRDKRTRQILAIALCAGFVLSLLALAGEFFATSVRSPRWMATQAILGFAVFWVVIVASVIWMRDKARS
jgi:putative Mn2+ efflux pump MntP